MTASTEQPRRGPLDAFADDPSDSRRREVRRRLASARSHTSLLESRRMLRFDPPTEHVEYSATAPISAARQTTTAPEATRHGVGQGVAWLLAISGAGVLGVGLGLIAWAMVGGRADLWNPALGATLAGQGLMIIGLVHLLASLWTNSRGANSRLIAVQQDLRRLQNTADSLAGLKTASPTAFYAELAHGASPQLLLSNLKGQLEQLASRLSDR